MGTQATFGRWLSARRHLLDLTQDELAQRVGCSVVTIRKLEADERRPSKQVAERLANSLGIPEAERAAFLTFARTEVPADAAEVPLPSREPAPEQPSPLPVALTSLIGRDQDLAALRNQLLRDTTHLLTLVGAPGIGKTSLALAVAREVQAGFADGAVFVPLAPISDSELVIPTIAQTLEVKESGDQPLLKTLTHFLRNRQLLLILDNFEQVLPAAPAIAELLAACRHLKVLVTSRAALRVRGEQLYPVLPLLLPDLAQLPQPSQLAQIPAVKLFVERAQAVQPAFQLTDANAATVATICTRLDGLPLAIELVAARVRLLPPAALLARLDDRMTLLKDGPRDLPPRHQTLRSAIAWSYDLLDDGAQRLFRRLGVFVGGCTVEAAEAVCNAAGDLPVDVLDGLTALLDQSLLHQEVGSDGELRFRMLETIREYALEQLATSGEESAVRQWNANYFVALAERAAPELTGAQPQGWLERLSADHANLRVVLDWSLRPQGDVDLGVRLTVALEWFWIILSHFREGHAWLQRALDRSRELELAAALRAKALCVAGTMMVFWNDYSRALPLLEESLTLARELDDGTIVGEALLQQGWIARDCGEYERAEALEAEVLAQRQAEGDTWGIAQALLFLGDLALDQGELQRAAKQGEEALALSRDAEYAVWQGFALRLLGCTAYFQEQYVHAQVLLEESRALLQKLGAPAAVGEVMLDLARLTRARGDEGGAARQFAESLALIREFRGGNKRDIAYCLDGLAGVTAVQGQLARAAQLFGAAEALRESAGIVLPPVHRGAYECDVAQLRANMDDTSFAAMWAEGQGLSLEQAIAYALGAGGSPVQRFA